MEIKESSEWWKDSIVTPTENKKSNGNVVLKQNQQIIPQGSLWSNWSSRTLIFEWSVTLFLSEFENGLFERQQLIIVREIVFSLFEALVIPLHSISDFVHCQVSRLLFTPNLKIYIWSNIQIPLMGENRVQNWQAGIHWI